MGHITEYYCDICGLPKQSTSLLCVSIGFSSKNTGMLRDIHSPDISETVEMCGDCFEDIRSDIVELLAKKAPVRTVARDQIEALEDAGLSTIEAVRTVARGE